VLNASDNGKNTMKNVNRIMLISSARMTGITKRLEKIGFIIRKNAPEDDRLKYLEITPSGKEIIRNISDKKDQAIQAYLKKYPNEKKLELLEILWGLL
jgi:DNA-binding MarR family transcriptional regulator